VAARQKSFVINTASLARSMPFLTREKVNANAEGFILRYCRRPALEPLGAFGQDAREFDFSQAPYISATRLQQLAEGAYIRQAEPVLFVSSGPGNGVGSCCKYSRRRKTKVNTPVGHKPPCFSEIGINYAAPTRVVRMTCGDSPCRLPKTHPPPQTSPGIFARSIQY
jgi:hypothetical protein